MRFADIPIEPRTPPSPPPSPAPKPTPNPSASPTPGPTPVSAEIGITEQPADIQPPAGRMSGAVGLALALGAVLVAGIVTVLILRRRRG